MRYPLLIIIVLFSSVILSAQENKKGDMQIGFAAGPSFANLLNSEAPHKINIYRSDEYPLLLQTNDVTQSIWYTDYKTSLTKDILYGITLRFQFDYYFSNSWSIYAGISYDKKGINMRYSNSRYGYISFPDGYKNYSSDNNIYEELNTKIVNNYLCFPIAIKYHPFKGKSFYIQGGFYLGKLLSSKIDRELIKEYKSGSNTRYHRSYYSGREYKELTNKIDYGFSFGGGLSKRLTSKLLLTAELKLDIGLRKVDAKYNNEYEEIKVPSGSSLSNTIITSTNYHGFNSNAKNISTSILIGINYIL